MKSGLRRSMELVSYLVKFIRKKREDTNTEIGSERADITTDSTDNKRVISMTVMNIVISLNLTSQIKWENSLKDRNY